MDLPGIVEITPDQPEDLQRAIDIFATSFMEENWFITWLSSLDQFGADRARKQEVMRAYFRGDIEAHAPHHAVWATDDFAAVACGYLASEFQPSSDDDLHKAAFTRYLPELLSEEEQAALDATARKLEPVSDFSWAPDHAHADHEDGRTDTDDHICFFAWAVDPEHRGSGAFRRLTTPFFDYADLHGINCYLECYSDDLQSLYEHVGFEVVRTLETPGVDIVERCMVRRPRWVPGRA